MIRSTLGILFCLIIVNTASSQLKIDWNEFKEPEGKLLYLRLDPNINIWNTTRLELGTDLTYTSIMDLSLLDSDIFLNYNLDKNENAREPNRYFWIWGSLDYSKYLNKRRGLFIETRNKIQYFRQVSLDEDYPDLINSLGFGIGRIEEISTVNQAYRIIKNVDGLSDIIAMESQEEIFSLARKLRELDFQYSRDSRIRSINQLSSFLDYFKERSVNLNNSMLTAQLVDGYLNSRYRPFILGYWTYGSSYEPLELEGLILKLTDDPIGDSHYGQKASFSLERWRDGNTDSESISATSLKLDLMKSFGISNAVRVNTYALANYFLGSQDFIYAYRIGASGYYTPNARTSLGISMIYKGVANELESLKYLSMDIRTSYYISYDTVLSAWFRYYGTDALISRSNNFNITLIHYFY